MARHQQPGGCDRILTAWKDENRAALQLVDRFLGPYVSIPLQLLAIVVIVFVTCFAIWMVVQHKRHSYLSKLDQHTSVHDPSRE